ncbi:MAG: four-carbon acid sugar kinase family protein [Tissierellia bacterium]|nr:four-carbon acid sugar kinase family protein [Tissierellia bacterium]
MEKYLVIADDLTGANANCSLMKKVGLSAASVLNPKDGIPKDFEFIALSTNSRAMEKSLAYDVVSEALEKARSQDITLYSKRVDSTLRGNIGAELNAFFDNLGDDFIGIAVPVYPLSNRVVINGIMLVNGSLLINSDAGKDTKTPVKTSVVKELFEKDLKYTTESIFIEDIEKGPKHLSKKILDYKNRGIKLLIFDGFSENHLKIIANAVLNLDINYFTIDPGPFTMELAKLRLEQRKIYDKVLMVVGSVTDITISQIKELISATSLGIVKVDAGVLADVNNRVEEIKKAKLKAIDFLNEEDILLVTTTPFEDGENRIDLKNLSDKLNMSVDEISNLISQGLAEITKEIINSDNSFAGIFISGGDITVAFAEKIGATGIEIREEIMPLAAYGRFIGGSLPGLRVISKGGMVGDKNAMKVCLEKLKIESI